MSSGDRPARRSKSSSERAAVAFHTSATSPGSSLWALAMMRPPTTNTGVMMARPHSMPKASPMEPMNSMTKAPGRA